MFKSSSLYTTRKWNRPLMKWNNKISFENVENYPVLGRSE